METRIDFKGVYEGVSGRVRLEFDYDWAYAAQNKGSSDQIPLDLAYFSFPIPGTPVTTTLGLAGVSFGKGIFLDDSLYILQFGFDFGMGNAVFGYSQATETLLRAERVRLASSHSRQSLPAAIVSSRGST